MKISSFDYELPKELIAHEPLAERNSSRLLHVAPGGLVHHAQFNALSETLSSSDLLVINDTKVFPARLLGQRSSGGIIELLLVEDLGSHQWRVLAKPLRKLHVGEVVSFGEGRLTAEVKSLEPPTVQFDFESDWECLLDEVAETPLPPYIRSTYSEMWKRRRYQTIYADTKGSIAAPTAGLHFTKEIFDDLQRRGIAVAKLTLHVGDATFAPIRSQTVEKHTMGVERFYIPKETVDLIRGSRRVVAVGTTTVRALESGFRNDFAPGWHETDLFITPGFKFQVVSGLITNFHLPMSTLLLLVSALGGVENILRAYREAVQRRYRFYSFGDAMLLYPAIFGAGKV